MCECGGRKKEDFKCEKIDVKDAVGTRLAHDITEIRPGEFKGPSFRKGHKVEEQDICRLMRLGKNHLYVLDLEDGQVHEDDAVLELAPALSGPGVTYDARPSEGKIQLRAAYDGLMKVDAESLVEFNMIPEVMCASIHDNVPVRRGQVVAGTRAVPLVVSREVLDRAVALAQEAYPIFSVKAYNRLKVRLAITGNEVYNGLIQDRFEDIVRGKLESMGASLVETVILPDDLERIAAKVREFLEGDTDMVVTTGGMSVDPDDVTRNGIRMAGVDRFHYGAAVLPGAMFQIAYKGDIPIVGIPACALHHKITIFDLVLPRLLAGEKLDDRDLANFAVGGLCLECPECRYPACSFGKSR